jgi:hypothetical protein
MNHALPIGMIVLALFALGLMVHQMRACEARGGTYLTREAVCVDVKRIALP